MVEIHQRLPEDRGVAELLTEQPFHEGQHLDVHEHGCAVFACKENALGQEIEALADGCDGDLSLQHRRCCPGKDREPRREEDEDEERAPRQETVKKRE